MTKNLFKILMVFGLVFITSSVLSLLALQQQDLGPTDIQGSRANNPPGLKPGITNPYHYIVKEDAVWDVNLTQSIFQDPNNDLITCNFNEIPSGVYVCYAFEAWIENMRILHVKTYRDKYLDAYQDLNITCSDGQDSTWCLFKINVTNIADKNLAFDEDTVNNVPLPATIFPSVGFTITACTIDEAVMGTFTCHLFDATIVSNTVLHLVPKKDMIGTVEFNVTCTNGTVTSTCELHVVVLNVNDPPVWGYVKQVLPRADDPIYIQPGNDIEFEVMENKFQQYKITASDIDGNALVLSTSSSNPGFHLNSSSWEFNFTPSQDDIGLRSYQNTVSFTLWCTDNEGWDSWISTVITFTVYNVNDPPVNKNFTIEYSKDSYLNVTLVGNFGFDKDGDNLTYEWDFGDDSEKVETFESHLFDIQPYLFDINPSYRNKFVFSMGVNNRTHLHGGPIDAELKDIFVTNNSCQLSSSASLKKWNGTSWELKSEWDSENKDNYYFITDTGSELKVYRNYIHLGYVEDTIKNLFKDKGFTLASDANAYQMIGNILYINSSNSKFMIYDEYFNFLVYKIWLHSGVIDKEMKDLFKSKGITLLDNATLTLSNYNIYTLDSGTYTYRLIDVNNQIEVWAPPTVKHTYPFQYHTATYPACLRLLDSQAESGRLYQTVKILRPTVNATGLNVTEGMKGNLALDLLISKATVSDAGVESEAYAKINRTITLQGTCHASTTSIYIYESLGLLQGETFKFAPFTLIKNRYGQEMIFPPVETDWDLRVSRDLIEPSIDYVAGNYMFRFAVVVWSEYGFDVAFVNATYVSGVISMDAPEEFPIRADAKGTADFPIAISTASVVDTTKTKAKEVRNVTRSIKMSGTCDPGVVQIYFYEDDGGGWAPLRGDKGQMLGVKPSGGSWSFATSISREISVSGTNSTRTIAYCALAWNHTDYNVAYKDASYKLEESSDEPLVSNQLIVLLIVVPLVILILIALIVGIIMFKRWDEKKKAELSKVAKKEDEDAQGAPGQPMAPGQGPPGQPGQQKDDFLRGPQYAPTPVNKQRVEVDASYANMFAADGTEKPPEPEISPDKQKLTFDTMTIENPSQSQTMAQGAKPNLQPPPPAKK